MGHQMVRIGSLIGVNIQNPGASGKGLIPGTSGMTGPEVVKHQLVTGGSALEIGDAGNRTRSIAVGIVGLACRRQDEAVGPGSSGEGITCRVGSRGSGPSLDGVLACAPENGVGCGVASERNIPAAGIDEVVHPAHQGGGQIKADRAADDTTRTCIGDLIRCAGNDVGIGTRSSDKAGSPVADDGVVTGTSEQGILTGSSVERNPA